MKIEPKITFSYSAMTSEDYDSYDLLDLDQTVDVNIRWNPILEYLINFGPDPVGKITDTVRIAVNLGLKGFVPKNNDCIDKEILAIIEDLTSRLELHAKDIGNPWSRKTPICCG